MPGLNQIDFDIDIAARRFGVGAGLMCGINQRPGGNRVHTRKADVQPRPEEVGIVGRAQVDFGVDGQVGGEGNVQLRSRLADRPMKQADQPAASSCSGLVPVPAEPGGESLMSRRPSELRDSPSRPPVVWVLPV